MAKRGFFSGLSERLGDIISSKPTVDDDMLEELTDELIMADIGVDTAERIIELLKDSIRDEGLATPEEVKYKLSKTIEKIVDVEGTMDLSGKSVILVIGVNGSGKTTGIAKMANVFKQHDKKVLLAAGDTFRAAAAKQLSHWADAVGVSVVKHDEGADPSAVVFDAISASKARNVDTLIVDTAGRLQNKKNLMDELSKMKRVVQREYPEAKLYTMLVLDANTGKNALSQVEKFSEVSAIDGIMLTKMDGTAKGGIVVTIADVYKIPVIYMGIGEKKEDICEFDAREFSREIL